MGIGIIPGKPVVVTHKELMAQSLQGREEPQEDRQLAGSWSLTQLLPPEPLI